MTRWTPDQLAWLGVEDAGSEGDIVTIGVGTPMGDLQIMASIEFVGDRLIATGLHIHGAKANAIGIANMRMIVELVLERTDCHEAGIEGAPRTTGANPGRSPRVVWRARRRRPAP